MSSNPIFIRCGEYNFWNGVSEGFFFLFCLCALEGEGRGEELFI